MSETEVNKGPRLGEEVLSLCSSLYTNLRHWTERLAALEQSFPEVEALLNETAEVRAAHLPDLSVEIPFDTHEWDAAAKFGAHVLATRIYETRYAETLQEGERKITEMLQGKTITAVSLSDKDFPMINAAGTVIGSVPSGVQAPFCGGDLTSAQLMLGYPLRRYPINLLDPETGEPAVSLEIS